jgi:hypothetical protein
MKIVKIIFLYFSVLLFSSCTTTVKQYSMNNLKYPEWMLNYEWGRNYLGLQYDDNKKEHFEYDQNNFFIEDIGLYGSRDNHWRLLINPEKDFEYLKIIEISYVKDNEKIYLLKNWSYKYIGRRYTTLPVLEYRNYPKYFKNMEAGEDVIITIFQVYQFDNDQIITEEATYKLSCFEDKYNPLTKWIPYF